MVPVSCRQEAGRASKPTGSPTWMWGVIARVHADYRRDRQKAGHAVPGLPRLSDSVRTRRPVPRSYQFSLTPKRITRGATMPLTLFAVEPA